MTVVRPPTGAAAAPAAARGVLAPIAFTLRTKGGAGFANRLATVATRFGPTPHVMRRRLERMIDEAARFGFRPSCPITATVLARHPDTVRALLDRGMEIAVHGLRHNDHLAQDAEVQHREMAQAVALFRRHGCEPAGFRAPYLRADGHTRSAVRAAGLSYQSDDAVVFDTARLRGVRSDGYERAVTMYDAQPAATTVTRPSVVDGLVRIPVCLPDDEMLVDRLHLPEADIAQVWCQIFEITHARGDLFTMQIHPERFVRSATAVRSVLSMATSLSTVWMARMDEIAQWWLARDACRIERVDAVDGATRYAITGDSRARLRLVGGREDDAAQPPAARSVIVPPGQVPAVAVRPGVPAAARRALEEDGFFVLDNPRARCAVEVTAALATSDAVALRHHVLSASSPVLAVDRWPYGARSALALTGDIDALTVQDFGHRIRENAHGVPARFTEAAS